MRTQSTEETAVVNLSSCFSSRGVPYIQFYDKLDSFLCQHVFSVNFRTLQALLDSFRFSLSIYIWFSSFLPILECSKTLILNRFYRVPLVELEIMSRGSHRTSMVTCHVAMRPGTQQRNCGRMLRLSGRAPKLLTGV